MARRRHPNKDIEAALQYAESFGWEVKVKKGGHSWGQLLCPNNDNECRCGDFCIMSVWSTPRNPQGHANQLAGKIDGCIHNQADDQEQ